MTPEGRVKLRIETILHEYQRNGVIMWWFKPVQSGYGTRALDYIACVRGRFVAIEAKRDGEVLRPIQRSVALNILNAGGKVFIVSRDDGMEALSRWLERQRPHVPA